MLNQPPRPHGVYISIPEAEQNLSNDALLKRYKNLDGFFAHDMGDRYPLERLEEIYTTDIKKPLTQGDIQKSLRGVKKLAGETVNKITTDGVVKLAGYPEVHVEYLLKHTPVKIIMDDDGKKYLYVTQLDSMASTYKYRCRTMSYGDSTHSAVGNVYLFKPDMFSLHGELRSLLINHINLLMSYTTMGNHDTALQHSRLAMFNWALGLPFDFVPEAYEHCATPAWSNKAPGSCVDTTFRSIYYAANHMQAVWSDFIDWLEKRNSTDAVPEYYQAFLRFSDNTKNHQQALTTFMDGVKPFITDLPKQDSAKNTDLFVRNSPCSPFHVCNTFEIVGNPSATYAENLHATEAHVAELSTQDPIHQAFTRLDHRNRQTPAITPQPQGLEEFVHETQASILSQLTNAEELINSWNPLSDPQAGRAPQADRPRTPSPILNDPGELQTVERRSRTTLPRQLPTRLIDDDVDLSATPDITMTA